MDFLYCDNKIAVCVKPRGVLSVDEPGGMPSLIRSALGDETAPVYTVHRLDAAVGGVMVYARTRHAASDLGRDAREGRLRKEYLAVVHGVMPEKTGTLRDLLFYDTAARRSRVADAPGKDVKDALLQYAVAGEREGLTLVRIALLTGRTHQIRCQFSSRGFPLWGDRKYGRETDPGPIALWSTGLAFTHPATGQELLFELPPPAELPWTLFEEV